MLCFCYHQLIKGQLIETENSLISNSTAKENTQNIQFDRKNLLNILNGISRWVLLFTWLLLTACDSKDASKGSQVIVSTQKAYQAYEVRKQVIDAIMKTHSVRAQLEDQWQADSHYDVTAIIGLADGQSINTLTGVITVDLSKVSDAFQPGEVVAMHPEIDQGYFEWQCRSNVTTNMVPGSCQD